MYQEAQRRTLQALNTWRIRQQFLSEQANFSVSKQTLGRRSLLQLTVDLVDP